MLDALKRTVERIGDLFAWPRNSLEPTSEVAEADEEPDRQARPKVTSRGAHRAGNSDEATRWWETAHGRSRLVAEQRSLDMMGMKYSAFVLADGTPGLAFPRGAGRELVVLLGYGFPVTAPSVVARWEAADGRRGSRVVALTARWERSAHIVDVVLPLIEPAWWGETVNNAGRDH